ncbi:PIR protein, putative [Plasmodium sp. gorilla clade G1]|nr:PIR protein, putative [Plasmodium sp. gorilla clade G1]
MKVHYFNILLFAVLLNILENTQKTPSITPRHIQTTRLLCECELFAPQNYDNDPEMKSVMQQFHDRTTQRFQEYDERLQEKRQICKDTCDKEIQKIILKDKIEKELTEMFVTLDTNIPTKDIPTCVCEKSLADKTEKFCHNCGYGLGSIAPNIGLLGGPANYGWKIATLASVKEFAEKAGAAKGAVAGKTAGKNAIIGALQEHFHINSLNATPLKSFFNSTAYTDVTKIASAIDTQMTNSCSAFVVETGNKAFCDVRITLNIVANPGKTMVKQETAITNAVTQLVEKAKFTANFKATEVSSATSSKIITKQTALIEAGFNSSTTSIYASIIVILIIVLIMVIIYLILRYRRKKKMKKKHLYIKLLEE